MLQAAFRVRRAHFGCKVKLNMLVHAKSALYPANSIFICGYLTTPDQVAEADYRMVADLGFEIEECAL